jgi:hypothetical protein
MSNTAKNIPTEASQKLIFPTLVLMILCNS